MTACVDGHNRGSCNQVQAVPPNVIMFLSEWKRHLVRMRHSATHGVAHVLLRETCVCVFECAVLVLF